MERHDPYELLTKADRRFEQAKTRHRRKLVSLAKAEQARLDQMRLDLINLATDLHAGLPREKIGTSIQKILENLDA